MTRRVRNVDASEWDDGWGDDSWGSSWGGLGPSPGYVKPKAKPKAKSNVIPGMAPKAKASTKAATKAKADPKPKSEPKVEKFEPPPRQEEEAPELPPDTGPTDERPTITPPRNGLSLSRSTSGRLLPPKPRCRPPSGRFEIFVATRQHLVGGPFPRAPRRRRRRLGRRRWHEASLLLVPLQRHVEGAARAGAKSQCRCPSRPRRSHAGPCMHQKGTVPIRGFEQFPGTEVANDASAECHWSPSSNSSVRMYRTAPLAADSSDRCQAFRCGAWRADELGLCGCKPRSIHRQTFCTDFERFKIGYQA
eukprot:s1992_g8.t1